MKIAGKHFYIPVIVSTGLVVAGVSINSFIKDNDVKTPGKFVNSFLP
jgi:hypothetical protein